LRTAIDTNVLSAIWSAQPAAAEAAAKLADAHAVGGLVICAPVYVELLAHPAVNRKFVDDFLGDTGIALDFDLDEPIWRCTAECFAAYAIRRRRSQGASPKRLLVDFVIAAHASLRADRLMTLDASRYRQDFPKLKLI
jgi:predicted nucleic acid-binding protein